MNWYAFLIALGLALYVGASFGASVGLRIASLVSFVCAMVLATGVIVMAA